MPTNTERLSKPPDWKKTAKQKAKVIKQRQNAYNKANRGGRAASQNSGMGRGAWGGDSGPTRKTLKECKQRQK